MQSDPAENSEDDSGLAESDDASTGGKEPSSKKAKSPKKKSSKKQKTSKAKSSSKKKKRRPSAVSQDIHFEELQDPEEMGVIDRETEGLGWQTRLRGIFKFPSAGSRADDDQSLSEGSESNSPASGSGEGDQRARWDPTRVVPEANGNGILHSDQRDSGSDSESAEETRAPARLQWLGSIFGSKMRDEEFDELPPRNVTEKTKRRSKKEHKAGQQEERPRLKLDGDIQPEETSDSEGDARYHHVNSDGASSEESHSHQSSQSEDDETSRKGKNRSKKSKAKRKYSKSLKPADEVPVSGWKAWFA
mmetsp:Transcript_24344/g.60699  ORF Transcript_24344/g.60699 Transcript_24344/m.60699 type:complete len:304 (-) Transcript_24344:1051-1962(-)